MSDWGQGSKNNDIGWGQGAVNNDISWGAVHSESWSGDTNIVGFAYDSDYQAVLDYATTQGYTLPSDAQKALQNQLLVNLKTAGVWSKLDTFANFATDGDSNFALIDWKRLTQYTAVNSPTFTANKGFNGNGTSSYIDTNFNPATSGANYTLNNASRYVYLYSATVGQTGPLDGNDTVNNNNIQRSGSTGNNRINQGSTVISPSFSYTGTKGMKSIHRTSNTDLTLFNATTSATATNTGSASLPNLSQYILRSGLTYSAHNRISMYSMGASLIAENTAYVNAFENYINSL